MYNGIVYIFAAFYQLVNYNRDWKSFFFSKRIDEKRVGFFFKSFYRADPVVNPKSWS